MPSHALLFSKRRSILFLSLLSILLISCINSSNAAQGRNLKKAKKAKGNKACKNDKKNKFCKGVFYPLFGGGCSKPINICDDMDETTADSCDQDTEMCSHSMIDPSDPTCLQNCIVPPLHSSS